MNGHSECMGGRRDKKAEGKNVDMHRECGDSAETENVDIMNAETKIQRQ